MDDKDKNIIKTISKIVATTEEEATVLDDLSSIDGFNEPVQDELMRKLIHQELNKSPNVKSEKE